jgi:PAS domain S-box-containing protein
MASQIDAAMVARMSEFQDRLEEASRVGQMRFAQVWAEPPVGLGMHEIDMDKVIRRVNSEELRLFGYREDQMLGRPCFDFIVLRETSIRAIEQKLTGERTLAPFLRTFLRVDGRAMVMLLLDRHIKDRHDRVIGIRTAMMETSPEAVKP